MITLTIPADDEMFIGLAAAAAGYVIWQQGSTWYAPDGSGVQTWIDGWNAVADAKTRQLAALDLQATAIFAAGHTTSAALGSIKVGTDTNSLALLTGANSLAVAGTQTSFDFEDEAGGWHVMTAAQIEALFADVSAFVQAAFSNKSALASQINAATTVAGVVAVSLTAGWPT